MTEPLYQSRKKSAESGGQTRAPAGKTMPDLRTSAQRRSAAPGQLRDNRGAQPQNQSGLPAQLKAGMESLSGMRMDHVQVHYNSAAPARLNAHAYAQGSEIHLAPGQEQHLPHEAWHVAQQAQGRVRPTTQMKGGAAINDDAGLEAEADVMGAKAAAMQVAAPAAGAVSVQLHASSAVVQRVPKEAAVNGLTHLVASVGGSLYNGAEVAELGHGTELEIEPADRIASRRGPNQEIHGEADRLGEQIYTWVRVLRIGQQTIERPTYVREDAINNAGAPHDPGSSERRQRLAPPVDVVVGKPRGKKNPPASFKDAVSSGTAKDSLHADWFHDFAANLSMLAERSDLSKLAIGKLLKFHLMQHQVQAPFGDKAMQDTGRKTSPLLSGDYARGMRTQLWEVATAVSLKKLQDGLYGTATGDKKTDQKRSQEANNFNKKFYTVSAPARFAVGEFMAKTVDNIPTVDELTENQCTYIAPLKLQIVLMNIVSGDTKKLVDSHMGGRGLRSSPSESAGISAAAMAELIKRGEIKEALQLIEPHYRKAAKQGGQEKTLLSSLRYDNRMLIAPYEHDSKTGRWRDPLLSSTSAQLAQLETAYAHLKIMMGKPGIPMLFKANQQVFSNLVGNNVTEFFNAQTPAQITASVTDALQTADACITEYGWFRPRSNQPEEKRRVLAGQKLCLERYYQVMQSLHEAVRFQLSWHGTDPHLLEQGIRHMLPQKSLQPTSVHASPHGLGMIGQVHHALGKPDKVGVLKSSYYETPDIFTHPQRADTVDHPDLLKQDLIVLEPHPNNAEDRDVKQHDPIVLIKHIKEGGRHHTVMMDVTLNHLGEKQIQEILAHAKPLIKSGKLNLILIQSGTKFLQHGMDISSLGIGVVFNHGGHWMEFNKQMAANAQATPEDDTAYLGHMLKTNKKELGNYLDQIRDNTQLLKDRIKAKLKPGGLELTLSEDSKTVYVAIAPSPDLVERCFSDEKEPEVAAMHAVYNDIIKEMADLSLVGRPSFGFNLTNLGECLTTIRITPGIETAELMEAYAEGIAAVSDKFSQLPNVQPASRAADPESKSDRP